eukprot:8008722-Pyramimonas_sp.AAC.1
MIDFIPGGLFARTQNDFPQNLEDRGDLARAVSTVRQSGAGAGITCPPLPCAEREVEAALALLKP